MCYLKDWQIGLSLVIAVVVLSPVSAWADPMAVRLFSPGVTQAGAGPMGASALQVERFDGMAARPGPFYDTKFGGGPIGGTYSGAFNLLAADQYGGAGGTGTYIASARSQSGYTLSLRHDATIPGVNFFGLDVSALDGGNTLTFYRNLHPVAIFTAADFARLLGPCGGGAYCGNPATGQNQNEAYGFISFTDQTGLFDQVGFTQTTGGGLFESDNHTVAYVTPTAVSGTVDVPEPQTAAILGLSLVAMAGYGLAWPRRGTLRAVARLGGK